MSSTSAGGGPQAPTRAPRKGLKLTTRQIVVAGLLGSITAIMGAVPYLGFIPLPFSPAGSATIMHVPVILAAILEGPVVGGFVGLIFGLFSFLQATLPFFKDPLVAVVPRVLIGIVAYYSFVWVKRPQARAVVAGVVGFAAGRTVYEAGAFLNQNWLDPAYIAGFWGRLFHPLTSQVPLWIGLTVAFGLALAVVAWLILRGANAPPAMAAIMGTLTNTVLVLSLIVIRYKVFTPGMAFFVGLTNGLPELIIAVVVVVLLYRGIRGSLTAGKG